MNSVAFVVLAAGKGERLGGVAKQFRPLNRRPLWEWSVHSARKLREAGAVSEIIMTLPSSLSQEEQGKIQRYAPDVTMIAGGKTRSESVKFALENTSSEAVMLHDGARPFANFSLCLRLLQGFSGERAVIPLLAEVNALKRLTSEGRWTAVDRDGLYITQTPQLFPRGQLLELLQASDGLDYKDEAELWLSSGKTLKAVDGARENFKITEEGDWEMARALVQKGGRIRSGIGYDVHPLVPRRPLILGGLSIPAPLGLAGHSDADLICHAAADALLGAAGLPDIGLLYPASDEQYRGARSLELLKDAYRRVQAEGWTLEWLDIVLTAQIPRLASWKGAIQDSIESILGEGTVNLKFKSGEKIDPIGSGQAMQIWCTATLVETFPYIL